MIIITIMMMIIMQKVTKQVLLLFEFSLTYPYLKSPKILYPIAVVLKLLNFL